MKNLRKSRFNFCGSIFAVLLLSVSSGVQAAQITTSLEGINNLINIDEEGDISWNRLNYNVINDSSSAIFAFAVSTNTQAGVPPPDSEVSSVVELFADRTDWSAQQGDASSWYSIIINNVSEELDESLPSFESLFGEDSYVNVYFNQGELANDISSMSTSTGEFGMENTMIPLSDFVAFTRDGNIIDQSRGAAVSQVPEPSVIALMGLGLIGLVGVNRRKVRH